MKSISFTAFINLNTSDRSDLHLTTNKPFFCYTQSFHYIIHLGKIKQLLFTISLIVKDYLGKIKRLLFTISTIVKDYYSKLYTTNTATTTTEAKVRSKKHKKLAKRSNCASDFEDLLSLPNDPSMESEGAQKSSEQETSTEERSFIKTFRTQEGS